MTLAVGQRSQKVARLGVMRLGTARLGWYQPWIKLYVNGVLATGARVSGATITDELNQEPNTASFNVSGIVPLAGQSVAIYCGDTDLTHELFGGRILAVNKTYEAQNPSRVIYACNAIDPTWLLNRRAVTKKYTSQSATAIALDIISTYTSGVTTVHVATGLATIDEITFTSEDVTDALTRLVERIGGYWYVDYASDLHLFLSETATAVPITTAAPRGMSGIVEHSDLSQIATRIIARGGGANALSDLAVGATTIPVEDSTWYGSSGTVESGPQRIAYTGVQAGATGSKTSAFLTDPTSALIASQVAGANFPNNWQGYWAFVFVDAAGNTTGAGLSVSGLYTNNSGGVVDYSLSSIDTGPTGTTKRKIYRTKNGGNGGFFLLTTLNDNTTTTYNDGTPDASLGTETLPTTNTTSAPAGSTSLRVEDLSQFLSGGGWAEAPGGQIISYTGRSASSGAGTITGIPASGIGSLTGAVGGGGTVSTLPHLTGVTGIVCAINKGDAVNIVVTVNDATAQTALAALVGGDGIHEHTITDGRWSITEATARANAELSLRKDPLVTVSFQSRDPSMQSGRDVTLTITSPAISGTFKIQRVTLTELGLGGPTGFIFPLRQVEVSSRRYSFEDLLRQLKKATT